MAFDGVEFVKVYYASEAPDQDSPGRKPSPKFLHDAAAEFSVDLEGSFMVGDKIADLECGWNAGVKKSILVRTGYGAELEKSEPEVVVKAVIVDDVAGAVDWILKNA
jgi:D-glycero-D-manno-heptose 1,7-bisphosphate phosphatase